MGGSPGRSFVDLDQGFLASWQGSFSRVARMRRILTEQVLDLGIGLHADGADQAGDGNLAVFINADVEDVAGVGLVLQPCAAVRDDGASVSSGLSVLSSSCRSIRRGTDNLGYDHALRAVDDEGAGVGHRGKSPMNSSCSLISPVSLLRRRMRTSAERHTLHHVPCTPPCCTWASRPCE